LKSFQEGRICEILSQKRAKKTKKSVRLEQLLYNPELVAAAAEYSVLYVVGVRCCVDVAAVFFREFLFYFSSLAIGRPRAAAAHGGRKGKEGSRAGQLGPGGHVRPNHATVWSSSNEADGVDRQGAGPPVRDPLPSRGNPMCRPRGRDATRPVVPPPPPGLGGRQGQSRHHGNIPTPTAAAGNGEQSRAYDCEVPDLTNHITAPIDPSVGRPDHYCYLHVGPAIHRRLLLYYWLVSSCLIIGWLR
jgi:hypothetical protein